MIGLLPICFPHVAHGLIRDMLRGSEHLIRGPPGPPGIPGVPGQNTWVSTRDNVVDILDYIKCKLVLTLLPVRIRQTWKRLCNYSMNYPKSIVIEPVSSGYIFICVVPVFDLKL